MSVCSHFPFHYSDGIFLSGQTKNGLRLSSGWGESERSFPVPNTHQALAALHDDKLLLGRGACEHHLWMAPEAFVQLLATHVLQLPPVDHTGSRVPIDHGLGLLLSFCC